MGVFVWRFRTEKSQRAIEVGGREVPTVRSGSDGRRERLDVCYRKDLWDFL